MFRYFRATAVHTAIWSAGVIALALVAGPVWSTEVTVKNDSAVNSSSVTIEAGFAGGEKAAAWLTTPCAGNIVAAQVYWLSQTGTTGQSIEDSINIYRSGSFPDPGTLVQTISGPQVTDGVINEFRYLDSNQTIPLSVPVSANETFIVDFTFANAPPSTGPSVVRDNDGIKTNRNAIYGDVGLGIQWYSNTDLGVNGDWVIRAVVDCPVVSQNADVSVAMTALPALYTPGSGLAYTITVSNAGPADSLSTTIVDIFPSSYTSVSWTCAATTPATCTAGGSGNITDSASLPSGTQVVYSVNGTVANSTTGLLSNSATAVVNSPATDPDTSNNTFTLDTAPLSDRVFADGFGG